MDCKHPIYELKRSKATFYFNIYLHLSVLTQQVKQLVNLHQLTVLDQCDILDLAELKKLSSF